MDYTILQLKDIGKTNYAFRDWCRAKKEFSIDDYKIVYTGKVEHNYKKMKDFLDRLYVMFNVDDRPDDFCGHSLSASDVVLVNGDYYYCGDLYWTKVTKYIKAEEGVA